MSPLAAARAAIVRVGARCPLGLTALQSALAIRADKFEPRRAPFVDKRKQPMGMVHARFVPDDLYGFGRFVALGAPALREVAADLTRAVPLLICLPEAERPDDDERFGSPLIDELASTSRVALERDTSSVVRAGHAGFAYALEQALHLLETSAAAVVVGAIDSYFHPDVARWLDEGCRLHAPGTEDGMIPGEGAAFVLLERGSLSEASRGELYEGAPPTPIATVQHVAASRDEQVLDPEEPLTATVLTDLVRSAAAAAKNPVRWLLSDLNGEFHRMREWSRVEYRLDFDEEVVHDRLPGKLGDVGAATGALALTLATTLWATECAPADEALITLCSDGAERGVLLARRSVEEAP